MKRSIQHGLILICLGAAALSLHAGDKQDAKARDAAIAKTRQDAVAKVESDDVDGAADLLSTRNTGKKGTVTWYLQSAAELVDQAQTLRVQGEYEGARRSAQGAIKLYAHALKQKGGAAPAGERAELHIQMAQVYETLLGDPTNARKAYAKALKETPDNTWVQQALARFAAEDSKFERIKSRTK